MRQAKFPAGWDEARVRRVLEHYEAEDGDRQEAVEVCEQAIRFGLSDGTKGDFPARIERLRKQAARERMVT